MTSEVSQIKLVAGYDGHDKYGRRVSNDERYTFTVKAVDIKYTGDKSLLRFKPGILRAFINNFISPLVSSGLIETSHMTKMMPKIFLDPGVTDRIVTVEAYFEAGNIYQVEYLARKFDIFCMYQNWVCDEVRLEMGPFLQDRYYHDTAYNRGDNMRGKIIHWEIDWSSREPLKIPYRFTFENGVQIGML